MKTRILSLLLALCLLSSLLPGIALAATEVASGTCGENLTWSLDDAGVLTISGTGDMIDCSDSDCPWSEQRWKVQSIVVTDGVTSIGSYAFAYCSNLESASISSSVTSIGRWAFAGCSKLNTVHVPSTAAFDVSAFWGLNSLTDFYCDGVRLPNIDAPTNLTWVKSSDNITDSLLSMPGAMVWTNPNTVQGKVLERLYREDGTQIWNATTSDGSDMFISLNLDTGVYYYTLQLLGDGKNYWNSPVATSEKWSYTKPDAQLKTPDASAMIWKWPYAVWAGDDNSDLWKYAIQFMYAKTMEDEPQSVQFHYSQSAFTEKLVDLYGEGYYYFRVRAVSKDCTKVQSSEWSDLSSAYYYDGSQAEASITDVLDSILDNSTKENVRDKVQLLASTEDLETALKSDQGEENGTADLLKKLEDVTGIKVVVDRAEDFDKIDTSAVEIVGAALNGVLENTETITLNIGEPEKENVIPAQFNNTIAVQFSMGLDGVVDQENLDVPVKITLPIPATINPSFLVVLHYTQSGTVEKIEPQIFQKDNQWFASFVLTSFSDFVMTETIQSSGSSVGIISSNTSAKPTDSSKEVYNDIPENAWYNNAVTFVTEKGLMSGTGANTFAPNDNLTRAMLAQILYNNENKPATSGNAFTDVQSGTWYADAITWASQKGIVSGYGNGEFGPNDNITREQFVAILWRYAGQPTSNASFNSFTDIDKASDYALTALQWAVEKGIISGKGNGTLDPTGNATRAETAQMLMNYFS